MTLMASWKRRSDREHDPYLKFFILYMCFDAWLTSSSGEDSDNQRLGWLKNSNAEIKPYWSGLSVGNESAQALLRVGSVEDMRPRQRGSYKYLNSADNFDQILDFLHQIRCNLFHGGKSPNNVNDRILVSSGAAILDIWVEFILLEHARHLRTELGVIPS